jgi:hypothetical protein
MSFCFASVNLQGVRIRVVSLSRFKVEQEQELDFLSPLLSSAVTMVEEFCTTGR